MKLKALLEAKYSTSGEFDVPKRERKKLREFRDKYELDQSIAGADVDAEAIDRFTNWFNDSKISNHKGEPIKMFHGGAEFDKFKVGGNGLIFFTDNEDWARDFGAGGEGEGSEDDPTYEVYINSQNPFSAQNQDHIDAVNKFAGDEIVFLGDDGFDDLEDDAVISAVKSAGFDAINMVEVSDLHGGADGKVESLAVFDPKQIFINHNSEYGEQGYH